jgi:hypothetical protein
MQREKNFSVLHSKREKKAMRIQRQNKKEKERKTWFIEKQALL